MSAILIRTTSCRDCGKVLTMTEEHYYEYRCEGCEAAWTARLQAWRLGVNDPELDKLFSGNSKV